MKAPRVNIVCQNMNDDRVIPRFARLLRDRLGWTLSAAPEPCEVLYLSGYFEATRLRPWPNGVPVAAYFTHKEEEPPNNAKARLFDATAARVQLRVAMCELYAGPLKAFGPTVTPPLPVERERFVIVPHTCGKVPVVGFSGYTYANHRKGEDLVRGVVSSAIGERVEWRASGRGWPVPTKRYDWDEMPSYYQGLDVLVCPSRVEGGPMPVLEALSCGVRVVIPRGVGILDEIPDTAGIYRYERGDLQTLLAALELAVTGRDVEREALREAVSAYSVEAFIEAHCIAFARAFGISAAVDDRAGIDVVPSAAPMKLPKVTIKKPVNKGTGAKRGIYVVAFGEPSRWCADRLLKSIKKHMADVPICLCAAKPLGLEDVFVKQPDSDVGGRRAKLKAYELAPAEWQSVLYLDADTEVVAPIYQYFEWVEDGWEFVICKDPHLMDTMHAFERRNNKQELRHLQDTVKTLHALQLNGGVWAFARGERVASFFTRWRQEWEVYAQRDQGALFRALYADPLKILVLGNEWNTFEKYTHGLTTAGLMHYPGDARRWRGMIPGRIDSREAWAMAAQYEQKWRHEHR